MSFFFPNHTYEKLKFWRKIGLLSKHSPSSQLEQARTNYTNAIRQYLYLGWFLSFIPGTEAFEKRDAFSSTLLTASYSIKESISNPLQNIIRKNLNPSWTKILITTLLAIVFIVFTLTGIGALVELGLLSGVATIGGLAILGKLALGTLGFIAAKLSLSTATLAIIATSTSAYLATLATGELIFPELMRLVIIHILGQKSVIPNRAFFIQIPLVNLFCEYDRKTQQVLLANDWPDKVFQFVLNPVRWVNSVLVFFECCIYQLIQIGANEKEPLSLPRSVLQAFFLAIFSVVEIPLRALITIGDIPGEVLKIVGEILMDIFWTFPKYIKSSYDASRSKTDDTTTLPTQDLNPGRTTQLTLQDNNPQQQDPSYNFQLLSTAQFRQENSNITTTTTHSPLPTNTNGQ